MALDTYFTLVASGSTATSAATAHLLLGTYGGLSNLSNDDVVHMNITGSAAPMRVWDSTITNGTGMRIPIAQNFDWPQMRAGTASLLQFVREGSNDTGALWAIWKRNQN